MHLSFLTKINQAQRIIIFILLVFVIASAYLFSIDERYNSPRYNQDWFALSFSSSQPDNFDFLIENFSQESDFQWEIFVDKEKVSSGLSAIPPTTKKEIRIKADPEAAGKITIHVSSPGETREIYKIIPRPASAE